MRRTILVVEDDAEMRLTLAGILEDEGYDVVLAGDGLAALDALATPGERDIAAIVLDLAMPRMDGFAFAEELTRRGVRERLPIIVLTADGRAPEKAARLDADGYLAKPFALATLLAEVGRVVGMSG